MIGGEIGFRVLSSRNFQLTLLERLLDNDVIPLMSSSSLHHHRLSRRKSSGTDDSENIISHNDLCLKLLSPFSLQIARKFYQEISFSAFNNFHIIQFYFNFPSLVKNYGKVFLVHKRPKSLSFSLFHRGRLKCHRILCDFYSDSR